MTSSKGASSRNLVSWYAATPAAFVVLKESPSASFSTDVEFLTLEDVDADEKLALDAIKKEFGGKTIGVQVSTTHANFLTEYMADAAEIRTYDTQENLDLDPDAPRLDLAADRAGAQARRIVERMARAEGDAGAASRSA